MHCDTVTRLDYCNSVLVGLPQFALEPLQQVQSCAARLIFNFSHHDHISACLIQLHWLPVQARVQYKLCTLMHSVHNSQRPTYISDVVQSVKTASTRGGIRPAETTDYVLPRLRTKFAERGFAHAGLAAWNRLPESIHRTSSQAAFKRQLKTFPFSEAFNENLYSPRTVDNKVKTKAENHLPTTQT